MRCIPVCVVLKVIDVAVECLHIYQTRHVLLTPVPQQVEHCAPNHFNIIIVKIQL